MKAYSLVIFLLLSSSIVQAFSLKITDIRLRVSKPETLHSLLYKDPLVGVDKTIFDLAPLNNERVGLLVGLNGVLIGYSMDVFKSTEETKTTDIIFAFQKLPYSKISLNYQVLKGFYTEAFDAHAASKNALFISDTKSTKIELFGQHNLYTLFGTSSFNHFFLNRPQKSKAYKSSISIVGEWSVKRLKLENPLNLLFRPDFFTSNPQVFKKVNAYSLNASLGPMVSFRFKQNINAFMQTKIGLGYFKNFNSNDKLKQSGTEFIYSYGGGLSWTSESESFLLTLKGRVQKGRHIETFFGDLSLIYFL